MSKTLLGYYSQPLSDALASQYGDQREALFKFDAFDVVQNECDFTESDAAMPLLKALVNRLDAGAYLRTER